MVHIRVWLQVSHCAKSVMVNIIFYLKCIFEYFRGLLKIAEVESRFENIDQFIGDIQKYGFSLIKKDLNNELFYFIDLKKENEVRKRNKLPQLNLNPCLYKKR